MVNHDQEEEDTERQNEAKNEPNINHLDVGSREKLVGDGLVQGVHDQHGGDSHACCGLEVFCLEIESALTHHHQAECRDECGKDMVQNPPLQFKHNYQPSLLLLHLPGDDIVLQQLHRPTVHQLGG